MKKRVPINQILLDCNNPRLFEKTKAKYNDNEFESQQAQMMELLETEEGISEIKMSICKVGFLPIDKIVVRPLFAGNKKYVVVEGNRRTAAIKSILKSRPTYIEKNDYDKLVPKLRKIDVLLLETTQDKIEQDRLAIQGIRHISGIKSWEFYPKAYTCYTLSVEGYNPIEIKEFLGGGVTVPEIKKYIYSYYAYKAFCDDEEYGSYAEDHPEKVAIFGEVLNAPKVREWLGWEDSSHKFTKEANLKTFYQIIKDHDLTYQDVRKLKKIVEKNRIDELLDGQKTVDQLVSQITTEEAQESYDDKKIYKKTIEALRRAPIEPDQEYIELIKELEASVKKVSSYLEKIGAS